MDMGGSNDGRRLLQVFDAVRARARIAVAPGATARELVERDDERPRARRTCTGTGGETVRPGLPRVVDFATATPQDLADVFQSRRATRRGTLSAAGRPLWPSRTDTRMARDDAARVGEHAFSGQGVPDGVRFATGAAQDNMPAIELSQSEGANATLLERKPVPHARAYFIAAMGSRGSGSNPEIVFRSSSELQPRRADRVRMKSLCQGMVAMDMPAMAARGRAAQPEAAPPEAEPAEKDEPRTPSALGIPRGVLGE